MSPTRAKPPLPIAASPPVPTPGVDALLARLRALLTRKIWLFGLGSVVGVTVAWLAFAFLADWALSVPAFVRWLHLGVLLGLPAFVAWRTLIRPLLRLPHRDELALLVERAHPELAQLLVSAVQLAERPNGSPALVARVVAEAESRAGGLSLAPVIDARVPHRRALLGAGALVVAGLWAAQNQGYAGIFLERLFGSSTPWPQRTYLTVSIPLDGDRAQIEVLPDAIKVRAARGTDIPVLVHADGVVPDEVFLRFDGGQTLALTPTGSNAFRTLLRSVQTDLTFHATGGDDDDGRPRIAITVLDPPDITGLAVRVTPPAYTGLAAAVFEDRDVQALFGSHVEVSVLTEPSRAAGTVQLLPADEQRELVPMPFFAVDPEAPEQRDGRGFELDLVESLRYRFELRDENGLANPDPGLFAIELIPDRRPEVELIAPGRTEVDTTTRGLLPIVVRAEDDFGLDAIRWRLTLVGAAPDSGPLAQAELVPRELAREALGTAGRESFQDPERAGKAAGRRTWTASDRLELAELLPSELALGARLQLDVMARDNRPVTAEAPALSEGADAGDLLDSANPALGLAPALRVRIVSEEELLRRVQDRLVRVRSQVVELEELNRKRAQLTSELLATIESDDLGTLGESELLAALTGARRVQGDAKSLARELAAVTETVLYARLDEKADGLLAHLDAAIAVVTDRRFHPEIWIELAALWKQGRLGAPAFAGQLVGLVDLALLCSETDAEGAVAALDRALDARELAAVHAALSEAADHQAAAGRHLEDLLERLAEWDNYQSILTLTRDILNRQRALEERTRRMARD